MMTPRERISGPLLDRTDIHIEVPRLRADELFERRPGEPSEAIRGRILGARGIEVGTANNPPKPRHRYQDASQKKGTMTVLTMGSTQRDFSSLDEYATNQKPNGEYR